MLILLACTATPVQDSDSSVGGVDTAPPVDPYAAYDRVLETGVLEIPPYTECFIHQVLLSLFPPSRDNE